MNLAIGLFSFALAAAYLPGISNAAHAPRWALMSAVVPVLLWLASSPRLPGRNAGHALGAALLLYATVSLAWSPSPWDAIDGLWHWYVLAGMFVLGSQMGELRPVYIGFALGICLNSIIMIYQWVGGGLPLSGLIKVPFHWGLNRPSGLFGNPSFAGEAAALSIVASLTIRQWWLAGAAMPALLLSGNRGGMLALAVVGIIWLWSRSKGLAAACTLLLAAILLDYVGHPSVIDRFDIWRDTADNLTVLGHGIGSFWVNFPNGATHTDTLAIRYDHAHSDLLEILYELGVCGGVLAIGLCWVALVHGDRVHALVLAAFLVEGTVGFPLYTPATAGFAMLILGHLCGLRYRVRSRVNAWGVDTVAIRPRPRPDLEYDGDGFRARGRGMAAQP